MTSKPQVHKIDNEWSYVVAGVSADPDSLEDYSIILIRLKRGVYSWMHCGHCKHSGEAESIVREEVEKFRRHPLDWKHGNVVVTAPAKEAMLELAVNAASGGHDLSGFGLVYDHDDSPNGYQARCRICNLTAWVDFTGLMYNLMAGECPGEDNLT